MAVPFYMDFTFWVYYGCFMTLIVGAFFIFLIMLSRWTHAILEFKARLSGNPLSLFFRDDKTVIWKAIKPLAGLIEDKEFGTFIINEKGSYTDKRTRNTLMCFDSNLGTSAGVKPFKLSQDLMTTIKDEQKMSKIREELMSNEINNDEPIMGLRESINFSHLRSLTNTILPHNITASINMKIAQRMAGMGKPNTWAIILIILALIGGTTISIILLKMYGAN